METYKSLALIGTMTGLAATGTAAVTDVTFIDGGYAEMCTSIAHNLDMRDRVELTGSRMSLSRVEICTLAIEEEIGAPSQRAASYTNRGVIHFDEGRLADALADFDRALELVDSLAAAHINRGYTLVAQERWAESLPSFDRGIELGAPEPARAHFNRGIAHEELGHVREAYADYRKAAELAPEWGEPQRELARFQVR